MKNIFLGFAVVATVALVILGMTSWTPAPGVASGCVGGTYYTGGNTFPIATGKVDTVAGSATDTLRMSCGCKPTSIVFSNDSWKVSGSPVFAVALYVSSNNGVSYGTTPVATYTVTPAAAYSGTAFNQAATTNMYLVNSQYGGNPYTNYMWVATNTAGGSSGSWQGSVTIR